MRKSKFSETQIVAMLKDAESGVPVSDLLRKPMKIGPAIRLWFKELKRLVPVN